MIVTVTGILSSTLVIPFTTGIKQATRPEIYATATYLAQEKIEELRSSGYTTTSGILGTTSVNVTKKGRVYTEQVVTEYVSHSAGSFSAEASSTVFILNRLLQNMSAILPAVSAPKLLLLNT